MFFYLISYISGILFCSFFCGSAMDFQPFQNLKVIFGKNYRIFRKNFQLEIIFVKIVTTYHGSWDNKKLISKIEVFLEFTLVISLLNFKNENFLIYILEKDDFRPKNLEVAIWYRLIKFDRYSSPRRSYSLTHQEIKYRSWKS